MYSQYVWLESSFLSICNYDPNYLEKKKKEELNYVFWGKNTKLEKKKASKLTAVTSLGCVIMKIIFPPSFNASVCYSVLILQSEKNHAGYMKDKSSLAGTGWIGVTWWGRDGEECEREEGNTTF